MTKNVCVFSKAGVRSHRNRPACMKITMKVEEAGKVCRDEDIWRWIHTAYRFGDPA